MKLNFQRRGRWVLAAMVVGLALAGGIAYATVPDSSGVIHGCYQTHNGRLRVVDTAAGAACRATEKALNWSQTSGAPTYNVRTGGMVPGTSIARAFCLKGEQVTGGGGIVPDSSAGLTQNHPVAADGTVAFGTNAVAWQVAAEGWVNVQAEVICAS